MHFVKNILLFHYQKNYESWLRFVGFLCIFSHPTRNFRQHKDEYNVHSHVTQNLCKNDEQKISMFIWFNCTAKICGSEINKWKVEGQQSVKTLDSYGCMVWNSWFCHMTKMWFWLIVLVQCSLCSYNTAQHLTALVLSLLLFPAGFWQTFSLAVLSPSWSVQD